MLPVVLLGKQVGPNQSDSQIHGVPSRERRFFRTCWEDIDPLFLRCQDAFS